MISDQKILSILNSAVMAPSGDNCQPWRFEIRNNLIRIFNIPEKDTSPYNYLQRASLIAHGALIENAVIAARTLGVTPELRLLPEKKLPDLIAEIELSPASPKPDPLYEFIPKRATNRKQYNASSLSSKEKLDILNQALWFPHLGLHIADSDIKAETLSSAMILNNTLAFENETLHKFLFERLKCSEKESLETKDHLWIKTLELNPAKQFVFSLLKNWNLVKFANTFGLSKIVAMNARDLCMSSSAVCMITAPDDSALNYIDSGRLLERLWLQATKLGLSMHVMSGITLLIQRAISDECEGLSEKNIEDLRKSNNALRKAYNLSDEAITVCFRIGRSTPPSATSLRIPIQNITTAL